MLIPSWAVGLQIKDMSPKGVTFSSTSANLHLPRPAGRTASPEEEDIIRIQFECNEKTNMVFISAELAAFQEQPEKVSAHIKMTRRIRDGEIGALIAELTRRLLLACGVEK